MTILGPKRKLNDEISENSVKEVKRPKNPRKKQKTEDMGNLFSSSTSPTKARVERNPRPKQNALKSGNVRTVHAIGDQKKQDRVAAWVNETVSPERVVAPKIRENFQGTW